MMMNKFLKFLAVCTLTACTVNTVYADYTEVETFNDAVSVSGYIEGSEDVTLRIKKGEDIKYFNQLIPDKDGDFEISFKFDDIENIDEYTIDLCRGGEIVTTNSSTAVTTKYDAVLTKIILKEVDGGTEVKASINNRFFETDYTYQLIYAIYDENDVLKNITQSEVFTADETGVSEKTVTVTSDALEDKDYVKVFAWENQSTLKPLCKTVMFTSKYVRNKVVFGSSKEENERIILSFLGDSITDASQTNIGYHFQLADKLNLYYDTSNDTVGNRYTITNNDLGKNCIENYGASGAPIFWMLQNTENLSKDADMVFLFGGTNDFGYSSSQTGGWGDEEFGNVDDETGGTFCGDFYKLLVALKTKYPESQIVVMTPIKRENGEVGRENFKDGVERTLRDYVNAEIAIAEKVGVPYIDMYNAPELDFMTMGKDEYMPDGLHPNTKGYKIMADYIYDWLIGKSMIGVEN